MAAIYIMIVSVLRTHVCTLQSVCLLYNISADPVCGGSDCVSGVLRNSSPSLAVGGNGEGDTPNGMLLMSRYFK